MGVQTVVTCDKCKKEIKGGGDQVAALVTIKRATIQESDVLYLCHDCMWKLLEVLKDFGGTTWVPAK